MYDIRIKLIIYTCVSFKYLSITLRSLVIVQVNSESSLHKFLFEDLHAAIANFLSVERDQQSQYVVFSKQRSR